MMPQPLAAAQRINQGAGPAVAAPDGDIHAAMAQIADLIVDAGEGLTLESLIKAFWRTYSTPEGNIVSIHEARSAGSNATVPEDAFARLSGRMDQIAESLGFLSGRIEDDDARLSEAVARATSAYRDLGPPPAAPAPVATADMQVRRRRDDDGQNAGGQEAPRIETGLPDRAQFEVALAENFRIARNEVEPLSVAICSVSRIEQIVEHHGLHTATRLMERVAGTLSLATKGECYSARKSNSEFIMLARGITISQFCAVLEESIANLAARRWHDKFSNETLGMIDMHVGIAHVFDFASPGQAMRAADLAHERAMLERDSNVVLAHPRDLEQDHGEPRAA